MKALRAIFLLFILSSCQNVNRIDKSDNNNLKEKIDDVQISTRIQEIEVDSSGNVIDTLSVRYVKKSKDGKRIYEKKISPVDSDTLTEINYYRENEDLFYSIVGTHKFGTLSVFESWEKDGLLEKAISVEYEDENPKDSIFIDYEHLKSNNGRLNKTIIYSAYKEDIETKTEMLYNSKGEISKEILTNSNDTIKYTQYEYSGERISSQKIRDYKNSTLINLKYDKGGNILSEEVFLERNDSLIKIRKTDYQTNEKGEIVNSTQINYPNEEKKYVIFKYD